MREVMARALGACAVSVPARSGFPYGLGAVAEYGCLYPNQLSALGATVSGGRGTPWGVQMART